MNRPLLLAGLVTAGTALWVLSGQFDIGSSAKSSEPAAKAAPAKAASVVERVRVSDLVARPMSGEVILRGRTEVSRSVRVRSEARGRIDEVLVEKGAEVRAGTPIARVAVEDRAVQLEQARAHLSQTEIELSAADALWRRGNGSEIAAKTARAKFDAARAAVRRAEIDVENTVIRAPFDGVVEDRPINVGDRLDAGGEAATVVDLDPMRAVGHASEREVGELTVGAEGTVEVTGGLIVKGRIVHIASTSDSATRTFRVEMEIPNSDRKLIGGLTARLVVPVGARPAHRVSPAVLSLADDGAVGVKTVEAGNTVEFRPVRILATDAGGAWLGGLPERIRLIVVGHEYVKPGSVVIPVPAEESAS